jgi:hypothetical protein
MDGGKVIIGQKHAAKEQSPDNITNHDYPERGHIFGEMACPRTRTGAMVPRTETSPGSSAFRFLALLPRFQLPATCGRATLVSLGLDFWADTRLAPGIRDAARQRLPRTCALDTVLVCCLQARFPTFRVIPGTRHTRGADLLTSR